MRIADIYARRIDNPLITNLTVPLDGSHVYHQYVVVTPQRDQLRRHLYAKGVETGIHYSYTLDTLPVFKTYAEDICCLNASKLANTQLSLPIDPLMTDSEINYVVSCINEFSSCY